MVPSASNRSWPRSCPLAERFRAAGHRLYLVGGVVRDLLLDREVSSDIDLTTDARPERDQEAARRAGPITVWTQGEKFGTIGAEAG